MVPTDKARTASARRIDMARLRARAEAALSASLAASGAMSPDLDDASNEALIRELRVHQVELEIQNEELRRSWIETDQARAQYFELFDQAPIGYCVIGDDAVIVNANLRTGALLGVDARRLIGRRITVFVDPGDQDRFYLWRKALFHNKEASALELRLVRQDGEVAWARIHGAVVRETQGASIASLSLSDITQHRRDIEERAELEARLRRSRELGLTGELAALIAHDLNNLLQVLKGLALGAYDNEDRDQAVNERVLEHIQNAAEQGVTLVRQLLSAGQTTDVKMSPLDVNDVVQQTLSIVQRLLARRMTVVFEPTGERLTAHGDRTSLERILLNLLFNARDAMPEGGQLTVQTSSVSAEAIAALRPGGQVDQAYVCVRLIDEGVGMSDETRERIFEPLFSTRRDRGGSGMGLTSVRNLVELQGGIITVTSAVGRGTTIGVYLPSENAAQDRA